ncbi:MAG: hypothetical protein AB8B56_02625 [Crocinitomicaceae bacterium]
MGKSIFDLTDKTGFTSTWDGDWTRDDFSSPSSSSGTNYTKHLVQKYTHPKKDGYKAAEKKARKQWRSAYNEYKTYYLQIKKIKPDATDKEVWDSFSTANKEELNRLKDVYQDNETLYEDASIEEKQWNKLDTHIEDVVHDFNQRKGYSGDRQLHPSLVKALMFTETEMGMSPKYREWMETYPSTRPIALYHLNLGRVTNYESYNDAVAEFKIPVNWKTNYKVLGNKNDVMLCAGVLMIKQRYSIVPSVVKKNSAHLNGDMWFNAVVAYKGVSAEGNRNAKRVYKLFENGEHPNTDNFKLY